MAALADSGSSDNAIKTRVLTPQQLRRIRPGPPEANLAAEGVTLELRGIIDLDVEINCRSYPGSFFVADNLGEELILGRNWLKEHLVVHAHHSDCLYIGAQERQRVFTVSGTKWAASEAPSLSREELISDFADKLRTISANCHNDMQPFFTVVDTCATHSLPATGSTSNITSRSEMHNDTFWQQRLKL